MGRWVSGGWIENIQVQLQQENSTWVLSTKNFGAGLRVREEREDSLLQSRCARLLTRHFLEIGVNSMPSVSRQSQRDHRKRVL